MKTLILILFYSIGLLIGYSQTSNQVFNYTDNKSLISDTVFLNNGEIRIVYRVLRIENQNLIVQYTKDGNEHQIDCNMITRFTKKNVDTNYNKLYEIEYEYYLNNKNKNETEYKLGWIQYNLGKFHDQERWSQICYGLGLTSSLIYAIDPVKNKFLAYASPAFSLIGLIIHIDSYKWMKRASIEPQLNKISVKIDL